MNVKKKFESNYDTEITELLVLTNERVGGGYKEDGMIVPSLTLSSSRFTASVQGNTKDSKKTICFWKFSKKMSPTRSLPPSKSMCQRR